MPESPGQRVGAAASAGSKDKEREFGIPQRIQSANAFVKFDEPLIKVLKN